MQERSHGVTIKALASSMNIELCHLCLKSQKALGVRKNIFRTVFKGSFSYSDQGKFSSIVYLSVLAINKF